MLNLNVTSQTIMGIFCVVGCFDFYINQYPVLETLSVFWGLIAFVFYTIGQTYVGYLMFKEDAPLLGFIIITLALAPLPFIYIFVDSEYEDFFDFCWWFADGIGTFITYILYNQFFKRKAEEISNS